MHFEIAMPSFPLVTSVGQTVGYVDQVRCGDRVTKVSGWTLCDFVRLGGMDDPEWVQPWINRIDVSQALDLNPDRKYGFEFISPAENGRMALQLRSGPQLLVYPIPTPSRGQSFRSEICIRRDFCRSALKAAIPLSRAYMNPSPENRSRLKQALGLTAEPDVRVLPCRSQETGTHKLQKPQISIILPVYNAFEHLQECLRRIEIHTDVPWRLFLIEDMSTDDRIRPWLERWTSRMQQLGHEVHLACNAQNLGFVRSVNIALAKSLEHDDHVVLINSDAFVPPNWASRLLHPILSGQKIASVTPLSNDAEIFSVPNVCQKMQLENGVADAVDGELSRRISVESFQQAPTGVGFCMAMNRMALDAVPQLDTIFGKGYGEEVDWCRRLSNKNWKHVVQPALFVEHVGGSSFGSATKQKAVRKSGRIISERYETFDQDVQDFISQDPLLQARCISAILLMSHEPEAVPIYFAHSLGGGSEQYLQNQLSELERSQRCAVVVRVGSSTKWQIDCHFRGQKLSANMHETEALCELLRCIHSRDIIYSCAVGHDDATEVPSLLRSISAGSGCSLTILVHDFFIVSPSYTLLSNDGSYSGVPPITSRDPAHIYTSRTGNTCSHLQWRSNWLATLKCANRIICFSNSSRDIIQSAFPGCKTPIDIEPHALEIVPERCSGRRQGGIAVLGAIGPQKGALVLSGLSAVANRTITIVGTLDPTIEPKGPLVQTGPYDRTEITSLAKNHDVSCWLIPSIWPETFCYTMHEALATGLPVFCFDIGAQADAAHKAPNGFTMPLDWQRTPGKIASFINGVLNNDLLGESVDQEIKRHGRRGFAA